MVKRTEHFSEIFDSAPIGFVRLSVTGAILELNDVGAALLADRRNQLLQRRFAELVASRSRTRLQRLIDDALGQAHPVSTELELERADRLVPVRMTASAVRAAEPSLLVAFEDITERRSREAELARTEQALREENRRKDHFIAMLSHELRNPLTPILTSVETLRLHGSDPAHLDRTLGIIDRSATTSRG